MAERTIVPAIASEDDTFRYAAQDYPAAFMNILSCLRQDSIYCDVRLQVETELFPCHRVVLMAGSQYFHAMFSSDMAEHDKELVTIGAVSAEIFALLLDFIYSGEIALTMANCEELLAAADMLSLTGVVEACSSFLEDRLQPENCIDNIFRRRICFFSTEINLLTSEICCLKENKHESVYMFASNICCAELTRNAEVYIHQHFLKVICVDEFYSMPKDVLVHFLHSESLRIENEYQVFKAVMDWILHNPAEGGKHILEIMKPVRFPIIPLKQMDEYLQLLADTNISLHVAIQKILSNFRSVGKSVAEKLFPSASHIEPHLTVSRKCAGKNIYIVGGCTQPEDGEVSYEINIVQRYDTFDMTWHDVPSIQFMRNDCGAGVINGQVCVVGGCNDCNEHFDYVETYDPIAHEWTLLPSMTTCRSGLGVCTMDNCLYALGCFNLNDSTIEKYDPNDNCWSVIGHCRNVDYWMSVTADNGLIYVIGRSDQLGEVCWVESFNPVTKEWVTLPGLINRFDSGVTVLDDYLYAVGGLDEGDVPLSSVERLCISSLPLGQWTEVSPMSCARILASVVTVGNLLYVLGGRNNEHNESISLLDSMECYDPKTDTWTDMGCMPIGRAEAAAVVI